MSTNDATKAKLTEEFRCGCRRCPDHPELSAPPAHLVDQAARALADADDLHPQGWSDLRDTARDYYRDLTRAVIGALAYPGEAWEWGVRRNVYEVHLVGEPEHVVRCAAREHGGEVVRRSLTPTIEHGDWMTP